MLSIEYANSYSEVLEILKYIPNQEYDKVPQNLINLFEKNSNKHYTFHYDPEKSINEQNVSKRAKIIIAILYRDYWATVEQRQKILKKQNEARQALENAKGHYDSRQLFRNKSESQ